MRTTGSRLQQKLTHRASLCHFCHQRPWRLFPNSRYQLHTRVDKGHRFCRIEAVWHRCYSLHRLHSRKPLFARLSLSPANHIQLFTHAQLMFQNECLGELQYEATTSAIFLAGLFLSFMVDYLGARLMLWRQNKHAVSDSEGASAIDAQTKSTSATPDAIVSPHTTAHGEHVHLHGSTEEKLNVIVLEAGIIFHSLR
jgi:hypothetical protein